EFFSFMNDTSVRLQKRKLVKSLGLFVIIRSGFVSLTHIGPFAGIVYTGSAPIFLQNLTYGGDLFFSGHTGLPFLMALVFWRYIKLRYLFIFTSIFFGIVVLLAHLHYTIDVLSAFFITFTIYHISSYIFKDDKEYFSTGQNFTKNVDKTA
ncbi:MAG: phosphatase PAP2-related protein, partial [bacterium]